MKIYLAQNGWFPWQPNHDTPEYKRYPIQNSSPCCGQERKYSRNVPTFPVYLLFQYIFIIRGFQRVMSFINCFTRRRDSREYRIRSVVWRPWNRVSSGSIYFLIRIPTIVVYATTDRDNLALQCIRSGPGECRCDGWSVRLPVSSVVAIHAALLAGSVRPPVGNSVVDACSRLMHRTNSNIVDLFRLCVV